jgi:predicted glutamine amidotransferase
MRVERTIAHAGSLDRKPDAVAGPFEPVGSTDTEAIFCALLNRFVERKWRSLADLDLDVLTEWLTAHNEVGELTLCLTDGRDLLAYADRDREQHDHGRSLQPRDRRLA